MEDGAWELRLNSNESFSAMASFVALDRPLFEECAIRSELQALILRKPCPFWDDDFGRIVLQSSCIEISRAMLQFNRSEIEHFGIMGRILYGNEWDYKKEIRKIEDLLNLLTAFEMYQLAVMAERQASRMMWHGDTSRNVSPTFAGSKECDGIYHLGVEHKQCFCKDVLSLLNEIEPSDLLYIVIVSSTIPFYLSEFRESELTLKHGRHCQVIVDSGIKDGHVCIVPVVDGSLAIVDNFVDYRAVPHHRREDAFWTDGGLFSWTVDSEKWDYKLNIMTERKFELLKPEQTFIIEIVDLPAALEEQ